MYIKIRKLVEPVEDIIVNIPKMALVEQLKNIIYKDTKLIPDKQILIYKGKQLNNEHKVMDYGIQLNDVIQLTLKTVTEVNVEKKIVEPTEVYKSATSEYFKIEDLVDIKCGNDGAWYEAIVKKISTKVPLEGNDTPAESDLIFHVKGDNNVGPIQWDVNFHEIRPRSFHTYKSSELKKGMIVLANYNIEEPEKRGLWYDLKISRITSKSVRGTVMFGQEKVPLTGCVIKFVNEIMRIEKPLLKFEQSKRQSTAKPPGRKYPYNCEQCKDVQSEDCKECGCSVCGSKLNPNKIILCDECDKGYHISCLKPSLSTIPSEPEWYCPTCKVNEDEIVKAGDKLKFSSKKAKMASSKNMFNKEWGKGMACVGRTKECTIVPKDHSGPIPGIEVGTCWKFRLQVSEAGVHRPHVAGIHGRETDGAYSLVLSGGYEDDVDNGEEFFYTGSGGRDLSGNKRVNEQSCDQKLTRMNKALAISCNAAFNNQDGAEAEDWQSGKPVRVVRNYKLTKHSKYAPKDGNRYDGIYKVVKYFPQKGKSGFIIWRYLLKRDDPAPAPWQDGGQELEMLYPPGYLEAQEAEISRKMKSSIDNRGLKRKSMDLKAFFGTAVTSKKPKFRTFELSMEIENLINDDCLNKKIWAECKQAVNEGQQMFLNKVQEMFVCVCCQELVLNPVTTECAHNICKGCLQRSFASEIFTCPHCRFELGENYGMKVNHKLDEALQILFPGYKASR